MSAQIDYKAKVDELWKRVQSNEESQKDKREIKNECDMLLAESAFDSHPFLVSKVKLIMHKAGKETDLAVLATSVEAELKKEPTNVDISLLLAEIRLHEDNPQEAITALEYAMTLGSNPEVMCLMSLCYRRSKTKDFNKSLAIAKDAIKLDMNNGRSWANLGVAYLTLGGYDNITQSKKAFTFALRNGQDRNADVLLNFGTVNELLLDFMEALKCYEKSMVITEGWLVAADHVRRVQIKLTKTFERIKEIAKMRPKKKEQIKARASADDEYVVVEIPGDMSDPAQIVLCFGKQGQVVAFGITKVMKAYLRPEKTVLKIKVPEFSTLEMEGASVPYHVIESMQQVQIIGGSTPADVPPVSITSSIA